MKDEFVVYVLYSYSSENIYIGYSSNLIARMFSHNNSTKGHTQKFRPWALVHIEFYGTKSEAIKREKLLKGSKGRSWVRENFDKGAGFVSV